MSTDFAAIVRPFPWQCATCGHHALGHVLQPGTTQAVGPCVDYGDCPCIAFTAVTSSG